MLCQKCGLQDATIHLESVIFRQKIEEHLCPLCAGVRAGESLEKRGFGTGPGSAGEFGDQSMTPGIQSKILQLLRLAKQQGYLTFADIEAALPDSVDSHGEINFVMAALEALEIEILDADQAAARASARANVSEASRRTADTLADYLKQISHVRPLTGTQATTLFKRADKFSLRATRLAFTLPTLAHYYAQVAARLLAHKERTRRVVDRTKLKDPALYLKSLPTLLAAVQLQERHVLKAWEEYSHPPSAAKRKAALARLRRRESALRALLPQFCFKLKVTEEYLARLQPLLREIPPLLDQIKSAATSHEKASVTAEVLAAKSRLRAIESEQRLAPARLLIITRQTTEQVLAAQNARTKLVDAHLNDVITIAKEHVNRGLSFIDLIKEGTIGLIDAVESFDHRKGQRFTAFAAPWIRQAIARGIAKKSAP